MDSLSKKESIQSYQNNQKIDFGSVNDNVNVRQKLNVDAHRRNKSEGREACQ